MRTLSYDVLQIDRCDGEELTKPAKLELRGQYRSQDFGE